MTSDQLTLNEITADTLKHVLSLKVTAEQEKFVASNAISIAQAHFEKAAWFRAIKSGDDFVGFAMLFDPDHSDDKSLTDKERQEMFLWRFMIDHNHQGKGYGQRAINLLIDHVKTNTRYTRFAGSFVEGPGSPGPFYLKCGFQETGEVSDGETIFAMDL